MTTKKHTQSDDRKNLLKQIAYAVRVSNRATLDFIQE